MQNPAARETLLEGRQALRNRDFASAAAAFGRGATIEPDNPVHLHGAAVAARRLGNGAAAETSYRAAISAAERLPGGGGVNPAAMAMRLVDLYRTQGRLEEAERLCIWILASCRGGRSRVAAGRVQACLGEIYRKQGRFADAERAFRAALDDRRASFGDRHAKTIQLLPRLADLCRIMGRDGEADDLSRQAIAVFGALDRAKPAGRA